jgi:hypothetical protein
VDRLRALDAKPLDAVDACQRRHGARPAHRDHETAPSAGPPEVTEWSPRPGRVFSVRFET